MHAGTDTGIDTERIIEKIANSIPAENASPNAHLSISLHSSWVWEFNGGMKTKIFTCIIITGCMLGTVAFGQPLTIAGNVCSCDSKQIIVQDGKSYWVIQRTYSTSVSGTCSPGSTVTVQCKSPDAQRKEGPCPGATSPTPPSG
jgi:hypothetical protein